LPEDFANHLLPNIFAYSIAIIPLHLILSKLNEKRLFYKLFAFNCLAMPFILSLIWIVVCKLWSWNTRSLGFSGITSAFLGALVFAYALFLNKTLKVDTFYAYTSSILLPLIMLILTYFTYFAPATIIVITIQLLVAFIPPRLQNNKKCRPPSQKPT